MKSDPPWFPPKERTFSPLGWFWNLLTGRWR